MEVVSTETLLESVPYFVNILEVSLKQLIKVSAKDPFTMDATCHTDVEAGPSGVSIHTRVAVTVRETGNGSSTNGTSGSETPKRSRKRQRRPETWKKNVAKAKRAKGEQYVSPSTGKTVAARTLGEPCKCKRDCFKLFSVDERSSVLASFNKLANKELQDSHLFGLITSHPVKRRRPRQTTAKGRRATYTYSVSMKGMPFFMYPSACDMHVL